MKLLFNIKMCKGNGLIWLFFWGDGWLGIVLGGSCKGNLKGEFKVLGDEDGYLLLFYYIYNLLKYI